MSGISRIAVLLAVAFAFSSCRGRDVDGKGSGVNPTPPPTDRIELPADVRENLGITFAQARQGRLEVVETVPGEVVVRPDRDWRLRAPVAGMLTQVVESWRKVESGQVVAKLVSPELAEMQAALYEARERAEEARLELARARAEVGPERELAAARERTAGDAAANLARLEAGRREAESVAEAAARRLDEMKPLQQSSAVSAAALLAARREALEASRIATQAMNDLNQARIDAAQLALDAATTRARVAAADDRLELLETRQAAANAVFGQHLTALAACCGTTAGRLEAVADGVPAWSRLRDLELRAPGDGVVVAQGAAAGSFVDRDGEVLRIVDPSCLMLRAFVPEGDLRRYPAELSATATVPGVEGRFALKAPSFRVLGDVETRSVLLEADLEDPEGRIRPGLSATARITTSRSPVEEVLVPVDCVVKDGLESVVFRRDPLAPERVVRTPVSLGAAAGGWVEVIAGVGAGDELVLEGVHQLRAAGLGRGAAGGHVHADGSWHEGGN